MLKGRAASSRGPDRVTLGAVACGAEHASRQTLRVVEISPAAAPTLDGDLGRMLKAGEVNASQVLSAQQLYAKALMATAQAKAASRSDTVMLFQALGGSWAEDAWPHAVVSDTRAAPPVGSLPLEQHRR